MRPTAFFLQTAPPASEEIRTYQVMSGSPEAFTTIMQSKINPLHVSDFCGASFLLGYTPFCRHSGLVQATAELQREIDIGQQRSRVIACLWCRYQSAMTPVLLVPDAKALQEDFTAWSRDNNIPFHLFIRVSSDSYLIALMPDTDLELARIKKHATGGVVYLHHPLRFNGTDTTVISKIRFPSECYLGLTDGPSDPVVQEKLKYPLFMGPFPVIFNSPDK